MRVSLLVAVVLACASTVVVTRAQSGPSVKYQLSEVQVKGAKRLTKDDVARLSGLEAGQAVTVAHIAGAAEQLGKSGLFKAVKYQYLTSGTRVTAIFDIEEADWTVPVMFDNFVWFADEEIDNAVKREVPTFDGMLPPAENAPDLVVRALQRLLESKKVAGRAAFQPVTDLQEKKLRYLFKVEDPSPQLCRISFRGASPSLDQELTEAAKSGIGKEYSRFYITSMAAGTLLDVYHRHGYWRAAFTPPVPALESAGCAGVSATLSVDEGVVYSFEKAQWAGNTAFESTELDKMLAMKAGDVADSSKVDAGLIRVRNAYGKKGYLMASSAAVPRLDDPAKRALFDCKVDEGPQFFMGSLEFVGLSEADAGKLTKMWKLQAGAPYDNSYPSAFIGKEVMPLLPRGTKPPSAQTSALSDKHIVNVQVVFER